MSGRVPSGQLVRVQTATRGMTTCAAVRIKAGARASRITPVLEVDYSTDLGQYEDMYDEEKEEGALFSRGTLALANVVLSLPSSDPRKREVMKLSYPAPSGPYGNWEKTRELLVGCLKLQKKDPAHVDEMTRVLLTVAVNAFMVGDNHETVGIYQEITRLSHSCDPNVVIKATTRGGMYIEALRKISPGEEVCIDYIQRGRMEGVTWRQRSRELKAHYGFECTCTRCCMERGRDYVEDEKLLQYQKRLQIMPSEIGVEKIPPVKAPFLLLAHQAFARALNGLGV